jgi:hypothetical protein
MNCMNKNCKLIISIFMVIALMAVLFTGCSLKYMIKPTSEKGVVSEVTMATAIAEDFRPLTPTTVFTPDAPAFLVSFKMSGFPVGAKVQAKLIYVGGDPEAEANAGKNAVFDTVNATVQKLGSAYTYTGFENPGVNNYKWPKGDYKVVITVDGLEKGSVDFKVE